MSDFYDILMAQPEDEAKDIALSLELFVNGSLNIFNHQTNVDVDNRFTVYGIRDLGTELSPITMLVMMESIQNRIVENGKRGKATWLYIDEFHVLLNSEYSAKYLQQLWKKVRKQGGLCTGITQNVVDLLQNYTATTTPVNMEGREGLYCLGFFETKSHNGKDVNQMRIENIAGCELLKKEESVDDVLVVYCAKHPAHKFTTVVGWYKHATVFRHYQEAVFAPEDIQYYNAIANSSDCVLLPAGIRSRKVQWEVPRKSNGWAYGFGRANVWYASEEDSRLQDYLTRLVKQIDEYDGENWIDKYAK